MRDAASSTRSMALSGKNLCGKNIDGEYWSVCGGWYEEKGISEEEFKKFQQSKGFKIGDIFVLRKARDIKVGDVIIYNNKISNAPIIHRVVEITGGEKKFFSQSE